MFVSQVILALSAIQAVLAHPLHAHRSMEEALEARIPGFKRQTTSDLDILLQGNQEFRTKMESEEPGLLKKLTEEGQSPPFLFLGCSDSRVSEGTVFNAKPGTLFTARNIANQFRSSDTNTYSTISYGVSVLGVKHVIVMGHYGCGGVAAAIATPPAPPVKAADAVVQAWIAPIRELFLTSNRPEIVELRNKIAGQAVVEEPEVNEPGFRALVEENVKVGVAGIAKSSALRNHYALLAEGGSAERRAESGEEPVDVFIHGWVYDIENGEIRDLGVSVGPPGKAIPQIPFPKVDGAAVPSAPAPSAPVPTAPAPTESTPAAETTASSTEGNAAVVVPLDNSGSSGDAASHGSEGVHARCSQLCKMKRSIFGNWSM